MVSARFSERPNRRKEAVGHLVESYFGIEQNNEKEPDFKEAGVELKTVPLKVTRKGLTIKERTIIGMIHYPTLAQERWETASVRKKLGRILFVFLRQEGGEKEDHRVEDVILWSPSAAELSVFEADWRSVQAKVARHEAHLLTERDAVFLSPCRKGAGNEKDEVPQPNGVLAKTRAFSLKVAFTRQLYREHVRGKRFVSLFERFGSERLESLEREVLDRLWRFEGMRLSTVARGQGLDPASPAKHLASMLVKKGLGIQDLAVEIKEFEQVGLQTRILNLKDDLSVAFEATSFPAMDLTTFTQEEWEESDLSARLSRILFVPTLSPRKGTPQAERTVGRAFFWSPSESEWRIIKDEWERYQQEVREGKARYLPPDATRRRRKSMLTPASKTKIVHMRPHGADATDTKKNPQGEDMTKQCFWLNGPFVADLASRHAR